MLTGRVIDVNLNSIRLTLQKPSLKFFGNEMFMLTTNGNQSHVDMKSMLIYLRFD